MNNEVMVFQLRKRIFEDWRRRRLTWQEVKEKYGFSKKWFYKYLKRYLKYGDAGLRNKERDNSNRPHRLNWEQKLKILNYVYDNPTHGPERIAYEQSPRISAKAVWNFLKKENLNTRRKRRFWAEDQGKPVLTEKEKLERYAKHNHIESHFPGQLVCIDTFTVSVKDLGKIWQYTACDAYSSYGWAKVYPDKTSTNTIDFLKNHILKNVPWCKIRRILTDQGVEFYSARHNKKLDCIKKLCKEYYFRHSVTKKGHPWTNGYVERLQQTIWQEFYLCRLNHPFTSIEALNEALGGFMRYYNFNRRHTGYKLKSEGLQFPAHAFFDLREGERLVEVAY